MIFILFVISLIFALMRVRNKSHSKEWLGKGYNTRGRLKVSSLAINLVFSGVFRLFEDKIWRLYID